jgi:hypothetical protein
MLAVAKEKQTGVGLYLLLSINWFDPSKIRLSLFAADGGLRMAAPEHSALGCEKKRISTRAAGWVFGYGSVLLSSARNRFYYSALCNV